MAQDPLLDLMLQRASSIGPAPGREDIMMGGTPKPISFFDLGSKLLQRYGTKNPPAVQELTDLIGRVPKNLGQLEQDILNKLKGRLRLQGPPSIP